MRQIRVLLLLEENCPGLAIIALFETTIVVSGSLAHFKVILKSHYVDLKMLWQRSKRFLSILLNERMKYHAGKAIEKDGKN